MVYTAASGGTVISTHYCMGNIASVSFGERDAQRCEFCGMEDDGCCHDLPQVIKMEDSNLLSHSFSHVDFHATSRTSFGLWRIGPYYNYVQHKPDFSADYRVLKPPTFILNCNFRI